MNAPNPFKPPQAAVADVGPRPTPSRAPILMLLVAGLVAIGWFATCLPGLFVLVDTGAMKPILGLTLVLGELCLAVGLWRAFPLGLRGRRSFVLAIALLGLLPRAMGFSRDFGAAYTPFLLAAAVAVAGFSLVQTRRRAAREQT